jgi:hypothetical protein
VVAVAEELAASAREMAALEVLARQRHAALAAAAKLAAAQLHTLSLLPLPEPGLGFGSLEGEGEGEGEGGPAPAAALTAAGSVQERRAHAGCDAALPAGLETQPSQYAHLVVTGVSWNSTGGTVAASYGRWEVASPFLGGPLSS